MSLISIDFHNTLIECDEWFRLEIETLPQVFMDWYGNATKSQISDGLTADALLAYRRIRRRVTATGQECDAVSSLCQVCQSLDIPVDARDVEQAVDQIMRSAVPSARPLEGAPKLLADLADRGHTLAVVSSAAFHPFLEWTLERFQMRSAFSTIVTSASCGVYKSNPDIYRRLLEQFDTPAGDAVHIGDSYRYDVASARETGMGTILLSSENRSWSEPAPDAVVSTLGEVPAALDTLLASRKSAR